jgi:signal transduction histidine kinase
MHLAPAAVDPSHTALVHLHGAGIMAPISRQRIPQMSHAPQAIDKRSPQALPAQPIAQSCPEDRQPIAGILGRSLRRGLITQVFCLAVAGVFLLLAPNARFMVVWLYSAAIGACTWLAIDVARQVTRRLLQGPAPTTTLMSPWTISTWVVGGGLVGYAAGSAIADALTGFDSPSLWSNPPALVVSLVCAAGASYYFSTADRLVHERAAAEAARRSAAENQLKLLESQLEPHMLFNTLANLRVLIALDPPKAQQMLDRLIAFLRATLNASRSGMHPLRSEFDRIADYLELMQIRMGARLQYTLDLPAELQALAVAPLLLQPLVENSIRHGLEPQVTGGRIRVGAAREGRMLRIEVEDDGCGLVSAAATPSGDSGFGLQQVRERLQAAYGSDARLELQPGNGSSGVIARIWLPIPA